MRRLSAALTVMLGIVLAASSAASANVPTPQGVSSSQSVDPATGHVTVTVSGTWVWPFSVLHATASQPCDDRAGAGWSVVWNDPDDPGYPVKGKKARLQVAAGATGSNGLNPPEQVNYDSSSPCGTFVQTDTPRAGAGNVQGQFSDSHVYASLASVPAVICVVMYDLGFPPGPMPKRLRVTNDDNTVVRGAKGGTYNESPTNGSCMQVGTRAVTASATTPAPARTASPAPGPTTPGPAAPAPIQRPASSLAYTGAGPGLGLLAGVGAGASIAGVLLLLPRRARRARA